MTIGTPQPAVLHLLTIFRQISAGEIRIPAFQREFVWKDKQIIDLLDSVRAGYPVGSILLWHVDSPVLRVASTQLTSFPDVPEKYPSSYVLDGMQRLTSLYGVFHYGSSTQDGRFNVWFDLLEERFLNEEDMQPDQTGVVPLAALFTPRQLLKHQSRLAEMERSDLLLERLVELQSAFQDYLLPVVQIRGEDIVPIVTIFEKINSTGTSLGAVDFMRAITWAQDFDLSEALDDAQAWLEETGFSLPEETIIKCIGMTLDINPAAGALLSMRKKSSEDLDAATKSFRERFARVASFFNDRFQIRSHVYVPYEGQILVAYKAIGMGEARDDEYGALERWLWATSFNESLRGKPDHYVVRAVSNWRGLVDGQIRGLEPRLKLTEADFVERRLIRGKALSSAFAMMFAAVGAVDLVSTDRIDPRGFLSSGDTSHFHNVLTAAELAEAGFLPGVSAKIFANLVLSLDPGATSEQIRSAIIAHFDAGELSILATQFIDEEAAGLLKVSDFAGFLRRRSLLMREAAKSLVEGRG